MKKNNRVATNALANKYFNAKNTEVFAKEMNNDINFCACQVINAVRSDYDENGERGNLHLLGVLCEIVSDGIGKLYVKNGGVQLTTFVRGLIAWDIIVDGLNAAYGEAKEWYWDAILGNIGVKYSDFEFQMELALAKAKRSII